MNQPPRRSKTRKTAKLRGYTSCSAADFQLAETDFRTAKDQPTPPGSLCAGHVTGDMSLGTIAGHGTSSALYIADFPPGAVGLGGTAKSVRNGTFGRMAMKKIVTAMLLATLVLCGRSFALGVDVGPVHAHTAGSTEELKLVVDSIGKDEDGKAVVKLFAHRKGGDDKFQIKVVFADLDNETKDFIKAGLKEGGVYKAHIEKLDDNWKLLQLRKSEDD